MLVVLHPIGAAVVGSGESVVRVASAAVVSVKVDKIFPAHTKIVLGPCKGTKFLYLYM